MDVVVDETAEPFAACVDARPLAKIDFARSDLLDAVALDHGRSVIDGLTAVAVDEPAS
jgi:hypothetical protein